MNDLERDNIPSLSNAFKSIFASQMHGVHTMLPGKVTEFNATTQRATIALGPAPVMVDGTVNPYPPIIDVPIQYQRFGGYVLAMPVTAGDSVAVFFSERSLDTWLRNGTPGEAPAETRFFNLADAFAVPGLYPSAAALDATTASSGLWLKSEDGTVSIRARGNAVA